MNRKLQEKLYNKYPKIFIQKDLSIQQSCMPWGIDCGNGWYTLLDQLCSRINWHIENRKEGHKYKLRYYENLNWWKRLWTKRPVFESISFEFTQVKEKYGCYDEETEVLTIDGWKYFQDISYDDKIATLVDGEYLQYHKPTDIISYKYSGDMYRLKTRGVDLLVTPNHNLYVSKGTYYNGRYSPPKKIE